MEICVDNPNINEDYSNLFLSRLSDLGRIDWGAVADTDPYYRGIGVVLEMGHWYLSPNRRLTEEEQALVWQKPASHVESDAERRICDAVKRNWNRGEMKITNILLEGDAGSGKTQLAKALSADFGLPYTKITCFADMDKSDILGSILPVAGRENEAVQYQYYPSEIVRAYENGWLLEIQEPTVIRDAAVLMALNSALEPDGSINLPTRIVHRHPDFIAVITTNRGYNGCRPLNEALRDRVQHAEKMDLPVSQSHGGARRL
mgnify:CR=1 FL=1